MALIISASVCSCGRLGAGHVEDVFLDDGAVQIVRAVAQRDLRQFESHTHPIGGDVIEVVEVNPADGNGAQGVEARRRMVHRDVVVLRLVGQRDKADEPVRFILQGAQLAQVVHAVGQGLDMAEEHGARAAAAQAMPGAMDIEVFFGGFLAAGDGGADFLAEDLRAAAGEGIEAGFLQGAQRVGDGFLRQPGQVQDLDGREALQLQPRVQRAQRLEHVGVVAERQGGVQPADDVQLGDAQAQRLAGLGDDFLDAKLEAVGVALLAGEGAELAAQDAVVRVVDVAVDDVAGAAARFALASEVGDGADGVEVFALEQAESVGLGDPLAGGDLVIEVAEFAALDEKLHKLRVAELAGLAN